MKFFLMLLCGILVGVGLVLVTQRLGLRPMDAPSATTVNSRQMDASQEADVYSESDLREIKAAGLSPKPDSPDIRSLGDGVFELKLKFFQHDALLREAKWIAKCKDIGNRLCCQPDASEAIKVVDYTVVPAITRTEAVSAQSLKSWTSYRKWKNVFLLEDSSVGCAD